ncbi:hypothetical protein [Nonomuraea sp. NPDC049400]|uniref:hypothetical protein n=1 Tax=Nonomuraea sp. NPDC049400 TaxID=3364352 RepID=UPI0037AC9F31
MALSSNGRVAHRGDTCPARPPRERTGVLPTPYKRLFPPIPDNRWNAESHGCTGTHEERTLTSQYTIDAASGEEAELRVLAWIDYDYQDDLRRAVATADEHPTRPGRWRVTITWDDRGPID